MKKFVVPGTGYARWRESAFRRLYLSFLILYVDPDYLTALGGISRPRPRPGIRPPTGDRRRVLPILARVPEKWGRDIGQFRRVPQTAARIGNPGFQ
jgi:hypothetical protein